MNETKLKVKGILLDLDGTIVDSKDAYLEAANTAFAAIGKKAPKLPAALEIPRRLEQSLPIDGIVKSDLQKFFDTYLKTYYAVTATKTKPISGVSNALRTLAKKAKLAVITMRFVPQEAVISELRQFDLAKYFTYVVTALDTHKPKPSPEALIKSVRALDVQICDCVVVGDSISDVRAGKAAGAKTVAVLSGLFSHEELAKESPDLILDDVTQLSKFLK